MQTINKGVSVETCYYHKIDSKNAFIETDGGTYFEELDNQWKIISCNANEPIYVNSISDIIKYLKTEYPNYLHIIEL